MLAIYLARQNWRNLRRSGRDSLHVADGRLLRKSVCTNEKVGRLRHTPLWRSEVFAGSRSAWPSSARLLDAQRPAFVDFALEFLLGSVRILGSRHLNETEATALAGMRVPHDVALFHDAILSEQLSNLLFAETRVDAGNEEVGARVDCVL